MNRALQWLKAHEAERVRDLAELVGVPSVSTDGEHQAEIETTAGIVCRLMREAGLNNVEVLRGEGSNPYAYGEWLGAPGKPTVFLYAHHDVQPANYPEQWGSDPWTLTPRDGKLYARGAVDDKGGVVAQLGAIAAWLQGEGRLPVNVKVLVEGEEEIGSANLLGFFREHRDRLLSDAIVVCDTENIDAGTPSITYSLRGILSVVVTVETAKAPSHSGFVGGALADAAVALNVILSRLYWDNGEVPVPGFYDGVRPLTEPEREAFRKLPVDEAKLREELGVLDGVSLAIEPGRNFYEQTSRRPALTVIAQEASSLKGASNQVLSKASAIVSCRLVPDQDPDHVLKALTAFLTQNPPWGAKVTVTPRDKPNLWWMVDPQGPAFEAAASALKAGYGADMIPLGCGGSIGFVRPLADLFGGAPALLLGLTGGNLHAPDEFIHEADWHKLMASLVHLFQNLADLPGGKVK
jgi:acetylornithine deacetylase/succinyl-diaminopimelate desuccinylase-like protein